VDSVSVTEAELLLAKLCRMMAACSQWIVCRSQKLHVNVSSYSVLIWDQTYSVLALKVTILGALLCTGVLYHTCV